MPTLQPDFFDHQPGPLPDGHAGTRPAWLADLARRIGQDWEALRSLGEQPRHHLSQTATYVLAEAVAWMQALPDGCIHAIVTDPPYGLIEYNGKNQEKLRAGRGGVWRIPPSFDGAKRQALPRFTVLSKEDTSALQAFFYAFAESALRILAPGGHVFVASNPLLSSITFCAFQDAGFEKRAEVIRLVQTLRGGDRPKGAEQDFAEVSVMPRSGWEPWGLFRKPFAGTAADNLRRWGTGGLRRLSRDEPFKDVIPCYPTRRAEKDLAPHPSLKPQRFLRRIVHAALPLGLGVVYDPFAGSGSTLAAAHALGYRSLGSDRDPDYFAMAETAFLLLASLQVSLRDG